MLQFSLKKGKTGKTQAMHRMDEKGTFQITGQLTTDLMGGENNRTSVSVPDQRIQVEGLGADGTPDAGKPGRYIVRVKPTLALTWDAIAFEAYAPEQLAEYHKRNAGGKAAPTAATK